MGYLERVSKEAKEVGGALRTVHCALCSAYCALCTVQGSIGKVFQ